jgi:hypothetical protein
MVAQKVLRPKQCVVFDGKPCSACTEDIELEKEIKELEIKIKKINIRRRAIRTAMNENHDPLIHKFPPEIASNIFMQYSPPNEFFDRSYDVTSPLYLGAVCQKWRQLAWATPQLWTSLGIHIKSLNRHQAQLVSEWLDRSASLPLTIRLSDYSWYKEGNDEDPCDEVINVLNKHSARWHDMDFVLPAHLLERLSGSSQENILSRLVLRFFNPPSSRFSTFSMKSKPSPTDLTLMGVGLPYVDIVWSNLTVASVSEISVDDCFELIRRAPLLETLRLELIYPSSDDVLPIFNTRTVYPHLRSLELLTISEKTVVTGILDSLHLPSLERWIHDESSIPLDNMKSFIKYSSSSLKIFKIGIDHLHYNEVPGLLFHLPSLEFLELRSARARGQSTSELISSLCDAAQSSLYLPHLQSLEFTCEHDFPWKSLPQIFALPRWQSLRVRVTPRFGFPVDDIKLLLELRDKGFDFRVELGKDGKDWLQEYMDNMKHQQTQH